MTKLVVGLVALSMGAFIVGATYWKRPSVVLEEIKIWW